MLKQIRSLIEIGYYSPFGKSIEIQHHINVYLKILEHAKETLANPNIGLTVIHFPIPHWSFIYDRFTKTFISSFQRKDFNGYLDNLALVDRTLGELRYDMEKAHLWEETVIILTSDHWWRESDKFYGKVDKRVPFLIKLAGQKEAITYDKPFNTVLIHDLILGLLKREISSSKSIVTWLNNHSLIIDPEY
jgi:hypothetical protein